MLLDGSNIRLRARIHPEPLSPVAGPEASAQALAPAGVQGPHELRAPGAEMRLAKTRTPHTGRSVFGHGGIGVALADGNVDVERRVLPSCRHKPLAH